MQGSIGRLVPPAATGGGSRVPVTFRVSQDQPRAQLTHPDPRTSHPRTSRPRTSRPQDILTSIHSLDGNRPRTISSAQPTASIQHLTKMHHYFKGPKSSLWRGGCWYAAGRVVSGKPSPCRKGSRRRAPAAEHPPGRCRSPFLHPGQPRASFIPMCYRL